MAASFFRGTHIDQNVKFKDKDRELTKKWKYPAEFDLSVDLKKVQLDVINSWIERRIIELMGEEDDIVIRFVISYLEDAQNTADQKLDPKHLQVQLTGFLEEKAQIFVKELWDLLLAAQTEPTGIPPVLIREKIDEKNRKLEQIQQVKQQLEKIRNFADLPQQQNRDDRNRGEKSDRWQSNPQTSKQSNLKNQDADSGKDRHRRSSRSLSNNRRRRDDRDYDNRRDRHERSDRKRHNRDRSRSSDRYRNDRKRDRGRDKDRDYDRRHDKKSQKHHRRGESSEDERRDKNGKHRHEEKDRRRNEQNREKSQSPKSANLPLVNVNEQAQNEEQKD
eukprot:403338068